MGRNGSDNGRVLWEFGVDTSARAGSAEQAVSAV